MRVCPCVCVRAYVCVCVCACVRLCVKARVRVTAAAVKRSSLHGVSQISTASFTCFVPTPSDKDRLIAALSVGYVRFWLIAARLMGMVGVCGPPAVRQLGPHARLPFCAFPHAQRVTHTVHLRLVDLFSQQSRLRLPYVGQRNWLYAARLSGVIGSVPLVCQVCLS